MRQRSLNCIVAVYATVLIAGCSVVATEKQEDLGLGIVSGTLGAQQAQVARAVPSGAQAVVAGQIQQLEGGAYVITDQAGAERRVPHDENTRIDRPGHVGDWIEAVIDHQGRAVRIRNIDGETES